MKNLFLFSACENTSRFLWQEIALDKNVLGGKAEWAKEQLRNETADALGNLFEKNVLTKSEVIQLLDTDEAKRNWNYKNETASNPVRYVLALQAGLTMLGHNTGTIDALFGENTKKAVESFQKAEGLKIDGAPGPNTIGKMLKKLKGLAMDTKEEDLLKKEKKTTKIDLSLVAPPKKLKTERELFNENIRNQIEKGTLTLEEREAKLFAELPEGNLKTKWIEHMEKNKGKSEETRKDLLNMLEMVVTDFKESPENFKDSDFGTTKQDSEKVKEEKMTAFIRKAEELIAQLPKEKQAAWTREKERRAHNDKNFPEYEREAWLVLLEKVIEDQSKPIK
jgi:hypothetical protein